MSRKNLRVLLDENIPDELAQWMLRHPSLNAEYVRLMPALKGREDKILMHYAGNTGRIMVTAESCINEKNFPICQHPGIIIFSSRRRHKDIHSDIFQRFMRSGHRKRASHSVIYLSQHSARILDGTAEEVCKI